MAPAIRAVMDGTCLAWGEMRLYEVPDGRHIWGREFQLLPSGSMFGADEVLHGLIGVKARPLGTTKAEVEPGSPLLIYGTRGTDTEILGLYQDDLADGFNA